MIELPEPEVLQGSRAFPETQSLFATSVLDELPGFRAVSWYGAELRPEDPAFCLVDSKSTDAALADLVGEIVVLTRADVSKLRTIYVYCLGAADLPTDIAVTRRAYIGLGLLTEESIACRVGVGQ